jgi:signal transduction histidine kinase
MTSHGDEQLAVEAIKAGALDYVVKSENTLTDMPHIAERALREWTHIKAKEKAEADKKRLEMQLFRSQKLEAIGTLAGGIAHDFNNVLGGIIGYTEMALHEAAISPMARYNMKQVLSAANRAKDLVKQILAFSRKGETNRHVLHLPPVMHEAVRLLRATIPAFVEIRHDIDETVGPIEGDSTEIHQIIMNLGTNAWHALPEDGGVIELTLSREDIPADDELTEAGGDAVKHYVKITVRDSGIGIKEELLPRIFDPYFTTKEKGKGTGLGLAVVHGIVQNHSGRINIKSELGKGSAFEIFFPIVEETDKASEPVEEKMPTGDEHILFVDDEKLIIDVARQMLESLGYKVDSMQSSVEALALFKDNHKDYDLVITDMAMQEMHGISLAEEIRKIDPGIPIILCTGYTEQIDKLKENTNDIDRLVMKPFTLQEMAGIIRGLLDKKGQARA